MTALERAKFEHSQLTQGFPDAQYLQELDKYEKEHKALEIIKKGYTGKMELGELNNKYYLIITPPNISGRFRNNIVIALNSKEEFNLLKEVLNL